MKFENTQIQGCYLVKNNTINDDRGSLTKLYHKSSFLSQGVDLTFKEQFITVSHKNVLRGMHFQLPPYENSKLISCLSGSVLDVIVDLRVNSPTFLKYDSFKLIGLDKLTLFIPNGIAHGFISLEDSSAMLYSTTCEYDAIYDKGLLWNSFGFDWPCQEPILSLRDSNHMTFDNFVSPFTL